MKVAIVDRHGKWHNGLLFQGIDLRNWDRGTYTYDQNNGKIVPIGYGEWAYQPYFIPERLVIQ